ICGSIALDLGDDAMQETMIAIFRNLRALREPAALHGWVRRIAVRESVRVARRGRDATPTADMSGVAASAADRRGANSVTDPTEATDAEIDVRATLQRLDPDQRAILVLR